VEPPSDDPCPELIETHPHALQVLARQPQCTENAIGALRQFAQTEPAALSDIAAAYYLLASREKRPSDFLRALEAAERAAPDDPAALFNLALIQETIGLHGEAIRSWEAVLKIDRSEWASEARQRLARLRVPDAAAQWNANRAQLTAALRAGNREAVRRLIRPFPSPALEFFEREVLPGTDAAAAMLLASELSSRLGDRYPLDRLSGKAPSMTLEIDRVPHLREDEREQAILRLEGQASGYPYVHARARAMHGYVLLVADRHIRALSEYDAAALVFERIDDSESLGSLYRTRSSLYRDMGHYELAWREILRALRHLPRTVDTRRVSVILNEAADSALVLGYPRTALLYPDHAIRLVRRRLQQTPPDALEAIRGLQVNLAVALRMRAFVELELGWYDDAEKDVAEAVRLTEQTTASDTNLYGLVRVRTHEARGRSLLRVNPNGAADAFQQALNALPGDRIRVYAPGLHVQRANALRLARRDAEAERDLEMAVRELRRNEARLLETRRRGEGERYWTAYFSRFDETYEQLIRHFMDAGQWQRAFEHEERSRAYEPLDLILQGDAAPQSFRRLVSDGQPLSLAAIQASLPRGTFLLQYSVLDDRTYTWIISRDEVRPIRQRARRRDVDRWSSALLRAARPPNANAFARALPPPFEELLAAPLEAIATMPHGRNPDRIVIVPDGAMHSLPFGALYDNKTKQHLVEKVPIEIAGSATLYVFSLLRDRALSADASASALLVGDPAFNARLSVARGLERLPRAKTEVEQIEDFYAPLAEVRTGIEATVDEFLNAAQNKAVVHVAGHSIVNAEEPWHSVLLLAPSEGHSGAVDAEELLKRLRLDHTRLVVLSACSSAGGHPVGPEGVAPLVRPLIAAGVPAVMGSLWDVEDATAEALSVSFHRNYSKGSDAAKALQAAQLELLRNQNPGLRSVLAWAPFQVIGHGSSPFDPARNQSTGGTNLGIHRTHSVLGNDDVRAEQ
jgi:CHAT domain-containing protein